MVKLRKAGGSKMSGNLFDLSRKSQGKEKTLKIVNAKDDIDQKLDQMTKQYHQLVEQLDEAYQKSGVSPNELSKYCQNPDNFKPSEWERFKQTKEGIETSITGLSSEKLRKSKEIKLNLKGAKERRGKTLGARKNWLNMR